MVLPDSPRFPIVTGTPPYFKEGEAALPSKVDQKACLFEFPNDEAADLETFLQSDQPQRFLNAVQELLEGGL